MELPKVDTKKLHKEKKKLLYKINQFTSQYVDIVNELERRSNGTKQL